MPVCENAQHMSNDVFAMILMKANTIRRDAQALESKFHLLGACHSFETMPEGSIKRASAALKEAAEYLDTMVKDTSDARVSTFLLDAAE